MKVSIFLGSAVGGLLSVLILVLVFRAFDHDIDLVLGGSGGQELDLLTTVVLPLLSTFFGAMAGSYYTYRLQVRTKAQEEIQREVYLLRHASLALQSQLNDLAGIKRAMVLPYQDDALRSLSMPVTIGSLGVLERIDQDVAIPLIRLNEADLLLRVQFAEKTYLNTLELQQSHHRLSKEYSQRLSDGGVDQFDISSLSFKTKIVGGAMIAQLYTTGEGLIGALDDGLEDLLAALDGLARVYKEKYSSGKYGFLSVVPFASSVDIFAKVPPPKIKDVKSLMELAGYYSKYYDPASDEVVPIARLAKTDWRSPFYKGGIWRCYFINAVK
ncbi:hypothetical protein [Pseudomonas sp. 06C 126]|uniref:hypothetical protein n=1 Tax=Pseudomonas sp. 06C 126 TaxID=1917281 RepID=UPI0008D94516|nr:hypothetical protein [Pseudomonas sp. 06C 126]OHW40834.1 hypothetical protein BHC62_14590 [Pseudomonas sp. 06C 126]